MTYDATAPLTLLGNRSPAEFLSEYWQKKPLLIRGAYPDFQAPLSPDELAGLACEDGIEARLVEQFGPDKTWQLSHGPFDEDTFSRLGERDWSLLVQAVDHYVPDVAELMADFRFIPAWRLDDIMISYAPPGGNVGPHVDNYDVFLLQASGTRRWQLGEFCDENAPVIQGIDLKMLEHFEVSAGQDWVLEPGDMLYLPPRLAHHGVSESSDCMTISVGFRAPSADEMITSYADFRGEQLSEEQRYGDADLTAPSHSGEIDEQALARAREIILTALDEPSTLAAWFGRYMTQARYPDQLAEPETTTTADTLLNRLEQGEEIERSLGSRFAFHGLDSTRATLFADGDAIECDRTLAEAVASTDPLTQDLVPMDHGAAELLAALINRGSLHWLDDDDA
ncbi:cupin domain-containing protein [Larsenimonas suaedae]|uniref:Cupin domain-containing protein n=1 Tax=Larsenimonas suaedae TaxID=1851019 RepID=A0ABU1GY06_9GAMM|nr:cupin domain-containing protein [Larsenimonas suaedae]MCM2972830.1 cupin domain-containing protein [Larsenimonas suaedae]MDR5896929.1 cupin domain-containing protein [Larsenimonas suaedae]